jgi:hypothetical protein
MMTSPKAMMSPLTRSKPVTHTNPLGKRNSNNYRRSHKAGEGDGRRGKGQQLRLELGSVVTGEGKRGEWYLDT